MKNSELLNEDFERKDYINKLDLQQARTMFKYCSSITQHVKMNQKSNKAYVDALWRCKECGQQDTNSLVLWCAGYEALIISTKFSLQGMKSYSSETGLMDSLYMCFSLSEKREMR